MAQIPDCWTLCPFQNQEDGLVQHEEAQIRSSSPSTDPAAAIGQLSVGFCPVLSAFGGNR